MGGKLVFAASLMIIVVGMLGVASELHVGYASPYTDVDVDTAYNMITNGSYPDLAVLDVRTQSEYDSGHIYGAVWIPHTELKARISELAGHEDHEIIVYCRSGVRSVNASETLDSFSFTKVYNMLGGILAWESGGYPVWIATVHNLNTTFSYDTIQAAIDAPQTLYGHTIFVDEGTYYENVVVSKSLALVGEDISTTIVDGNNQGTVFDIIRNNVNVTRFTIQNSGFASSGIYMNNVIHCNITENNITNNGYGVHLSWSSNNTFFGNNITANNEWGGIRLYCSSNNSVSGNNISSNRYGITLSQSANNNISGNLFTNDGLLISDSYDNMVEGNSVNGRPLVYLEGASGFRVVDAGQVILVNCSGIILENLNISRTDTGIQLHETEDTRIANNEIANNDCGIHLDYSSNNSLSGNNITENSLWGIYLDDSYYNGVSGNNIRANGYGIDLYDSHYNGVLENNITENVNVGIYPHYSSGNSVLGNNINENKNHGIRLHYSSNNGFSGNNVNENNNYGISVFSSSDNAIFHNNFAGNTQQIECYDASVNVWDCGYPSGGNYWSDYLGVDLYEGTYQNKIGSDGIGDKPHDIDENNRDNYPLMGMFSDFNATLEHHVQTICNSTISKFGFNGTAISFNVTGEDGTDGFCRICIPKALMNETYRVFVNGTEILPPLEPLPFSNSTHNYLYFTYSHSTQEVIIIPEFPSIIILPIFMIATLLAVIAYREKCPTPK